MLENGEDDLVSLPKAFAEGLGQKVQRRGGAISRYDLLWRNRAEKSRNIGARGLVFGKRLLG